MQEGKRRNSIELLIDENYVITEGNSSSDKELKPLPVKKPPKKKRKVRVKFMDDVLKYWRVVRKWVVVKYPELSMADLELLLFLYTEDPFNQTEFNEFTAIYNWDKKRFGNLMRNEWIIVWRKRNVKRKEARLFKISRKGSLLCSNVYEKLLLQTEISEDWEKSPMFSKKRETYSSKVYRNAIKKMNEKVRVLKKEKGTS